MGFGVVGVVLQLVLEGGARLVETAEQDQEAAEIVGRFAEARVDVERALVARQRAVELVERLQHGAAVVVRLDVFRIERERAVEAHECLVGATERAQEAAAVVMRLGVIRLDRDRLAIGVERLVGAAQRHEHGAAVVVRLGEPGFQLERAVEAFQRLLAALERVEDQSVIEQELRRGRAHAHGGGDEIERLGRVALGELDQRHHLQRVGVVGTRRQHLRVERLGLGDEPALVKLQRLGEGLRHVERARPRQRLRHAIRFSPVDG